MTPPSPPPPTAQHHPHHPSTAPSANTTQNTLAALLDPASHHWASSHRFPAVVGSPNAAPTPSDTATLATDADARSRASRRSDRTPSRLPATEPASSSASLDAAAAPRTADQDVGRASNSVANILRRDRARSWSKHAGSAFTPADAAPAEPSSRAVSPTLITGSHVAESSHQSRDGEQTRRHSRHDGRGSSSRQDRQRGDHEPSGALSHSARRRPQRSRASSSASITTAASSSTSPMVTATAADSGRPHTFRHADSSAGMGRRPGSVRSRSTRAMTTPSSPVLSAGSLGPTASPGSFAHLSDAQLAAQLAYTLQQQGSLPASPSLSRTGSGFFDPIFESAASVHSHHMRQFVPGDPALSYFPPMSAGASPHLGPTSAADMAQQAAHLLGLHHILASRSTPHLPHLGAGVIDGSGGAEDAFGSPDAPPPPYAPRASETEQELQRGVAGMGTASGPAPRRPASAMAGSASSSSSHDPPLPPPIAIPMPATQQPHLGRQSHSHSRRHSRNALSPGMSALSSSVGHRSTPSSPTLSFNGHRVASMISPLPRGLGMTPVSSTLSPDAFSSGNGNLSPGGIFAASSDEDDDDDDDDGVHGGLSFSPALARERRHERQASSTRSTAERSRPATSLAETSSAGTLPTSRPRSSSGAAARKARQQPSTQSEPPRRQQTLLVSQASNGPGPLAGVASVPNGGLPPAERGPARRLSQHEADDDPPPPRRSSQPREAFLSEDAMDRRSLSPTPSDFEQLSRELAGLAEASETFNDGAAEVPFANGDDEEIPWVLRVLLHPLRWLAVVPGCLGSFWLARNAHLLATVATPGASGLYSSVVGGVRHPGALDFAVSTLWSLGTAHYALSFTTLLLRRWLVYYSILPSLIRLLALQAICWPLVRLTVHVFGPNQPLGAWVVIGSTTALSDIVARWVTSNIADAVLEGDADAEDTEDDGDGEEDYFVDEFGQARLKPPQWHKYRMQMQEQRLRRRRSPASDANDPRSGDESDATVVRLAAGRAGRSSSSSRRRRKGGQGTRFWRAVIGGPTTAGGRKPQRRAGQSGGAGGGGSSPSPSPSSSTAQAYLSGTETEWDGGIESDATGYPGRLSGLRRRVGAARSGLGLLSTDDEGGETSAAEAVASPRTILGTPRPPRSTRTATSGGGGGATGVGRRREFHWNVALRRNILPLAMVGYVSMWFLIIDALRLGQRGSGGVGAST